MPRFSNLSLALVFGVATAAATADAYAGELKLFSKAPATDDSGKLSGDATTTAELASLPGEEIWELHLWAKLDKGAPGPLYAEFLGKLPGSGKRYKVQNFEKSDYDGEKYVTWSIELDGNIGFNRDRTYTVEMVQLNAKGKNLVLASSKIKLVYTAEEEPEDDGGDEEEGEDDGEDLDDQDVHDSFAGDDDGAGDGPPPVAPPAKKKGCSVDPEPFSGPGVLLMIALGAMLRRRRD